MFAQSFMVEQQHRPCWHNAGISKILDNNGWKSNTGTSHQGLGNSNHSREFSAACCIRGYHIYSWTQWTAEIRSILTSEPEKRPGALIEDKYAIAIISNNQTIGHVPKLLSKLTFFFLKHGATLTVKVTGNTNGVYLQIRKEGTYWPNEREDIGGEKEIWREKKKDGK